MKFTEISPYTFPSGNEIGFLTNMNNYDEKFDFVKLKTLGWDKTIFSKSAKHEDGICFSIVPPSENRFYISYGSRVKTD